MQQGQPIEIIDKIELFKNVSTCASMGFTAMTDSAILQYIKT
jgi:hypothetical protein